MMDLQQKKNLSFIIIGLIFLLSGIEYAVILPTIWKYLQILEAPPYFLGLGLSAFSFSSLLSGPVFGLWSDRSRTTKSIILFSNVFEVVGNIMYFVGFSKWLLLSSRLVAGIGAGAGSSIFGYLTTNTVPAERARVFAAVMACRQAGLLIGPAFNIFLRLCDFSLGPFVVDKYTSPGLFMCALWLLLELLVFLLYWDLPPPESAELHTLVQRLHDEEEEAEEEPLLMSPEDPMDTYGTVNTDESNAQPETPPSPPTPPLTPPDPFQNFSMSNEFLREEVVVLLTAQFITLFNQTALETMVTPLTQRYFGFGELGNSVMYSLCGVEVILGFFFVRWLSRVVADRAVLAVGLVTCSVACVWCIVFLANPRGGFSVELLEFVVGVFLQLLGLPFVAVSQVSLFSKVTAEKTQGFSQGVRRSVGGLATILGPLWAGGLTANLYVMLGMMLVLLTLVTVSRRPRAAQLVASAESRPGDPDGLVCCR
ncbi:major facilitator superfamily domain-containing protein 8 isoform X1 [Denticeps clupeoides]|uniref:major facilitator superfamily domain-containing protein 8 isoform X1 n=2 Tax=Denticeps clupeoides TaxID=299321 RepID=UPI0010A3342E|nr:major facilitator superfamily domain-containing protein 8-like isoform X1 [Denticeps clupeoides]